MCWDRICDFFRGEGQLRKGGRGNDLKCIEDLLRQIVCSQGEILNNQNRQESILCEISCKVDKIMATLEQFNAAFARIDKATTAIGEQLKNIAGSMTTPEEKEAHDKLLALATTLEAMAKVPENPVPVPVPEPLPPL